MSHVRRFRFLRELAAVHWPWFPQPRVEEPFRRTFEADLMGVKADRLFRVGDPRPAPFVVRAPHLQESPVDNMQDPVRLFAFRSLLNAVCRESRDRSNSSCRCHGVSLAVCDRETQTRQCDGCCPCLLSGTSGRTADGTPKLRVIPKDERPGPINQFVNSTAESPSVNSG